MKGEQARLARKRPAEAEEGAAAAAATAGEEAGAPPPRKKAHVDRRLKKRQKKKEKKARLREQSSSIGSASSGGGEAADPKSRPQQQQQQPEEEKTSKNKNKKKKNKKKKKEEKSDSANGGSVEAEHEAVEDEASPSLDHPFDADPDDHCETPLEAYEDIQPLLEQMARNLGKKPSELLIYDPYYCAGGVVERLAALGFTNVYNRNEDCYAQWAEAGRPGVALVDYDILLTNPPYSADHLERICDFCRDSRKPWLLLAPNFLHKKDYYERSLVTPHHDLGQRPFYLVPRGTRRYIYLPPRGARSKKQSDTHVKTSPFVTLWHCWCGSRWNKFMLEQWWPRLVPRTVVDKLELARSKSALRDLRRKK